MAQTIFPALRYRDAEAALEWLEQAFGAEIVRELEDMDYGPREYSVRDPEGVLWSFGTYSPDAV
jgi:uncharacterized glyoxalase superfamily protein PhnB